MNYKYLGNITNIPDYKSWSQEMIKPNTIGNSPDFLKEAKIKGRKWVADFYEEQLGYPNGSVVGADPEDFSKWGIIDDSVVQHLGQLLGMNKPSGRVQLLAPGAMVPLHIDNLQLGYIDGADQVVQKNEFTAQELSELAVNPRLATRVLIFLEDWRHGQGVIFDDSWLDHWKAGDIVTWDWVTGIHATVNCGYWERPLLRLSGLVTDKFDQFRSSSTTFNLTY